MALFAAPRRIGVAFHHHRVRHAAVLLHRWTGLLIAGFLVVTASTGALLAFADEIEVLLSPALFVGRPVAAGTALRDPLDLRDELARRHPAARVDRVTFDTPPGRTVRFRLDPLPGSVLTGDDEWFVDPTTGRETGSRRRGDLSQGWKNAVPFVERLHRSLALGRPGAVVLGTASLLWTLDCLVGLFLSFPLHKRGPTTALGWLQRWKPAWNVRWQGGPTKLTFDLHRAAGLWVWLLLLVFAWSGVGFNLPGVYRPAMNAVFGSEPGDNAVRPFHGALPAAHPIDWHTAHRLSAAAMTAAASRLGFRVDHERLLRFDAARGVYEYRVSSSRDAGRHGNTTLLLDAETGRVVRLVLPTGVAAGATVGAWIMAVHTASVGGVVGQAAISAVGLVVIVLSVTGVLVWQRRRVGRRAARALFEARR